MAKLLVIAYYFPPAGGAGVQRTLKFTKYLPEFGWEPVVLTVDAGYAKLLDGSLENEIPEVTQIHRTSAWLLPQWLPWRLRKFISKWLLLVDEQLGWYPFAVRRAEGVIIESNVQAIYSTSGPFTDHLIGLRLAEKTGLPWIADFRDPWIGNFASAFPTRFHRSLALRLEKKVVDKAQRIVVVSEPMRQALLSRHPILAPEQVVTIHNGYDLADFAGILPYAFPPGCLAIVYTGSFYAQGITPKAFLLALKGLVDSNVIPRQEIQVYLVGNIGVAAREMVRKLDLMDVVTMTGYISHMQSVSFILGADILLLVVGPGEESEYVLTGKIFEYLAAHKPILALAPPGAAAQLIEKASAGFVIHPQDPEGISNQLASIYNSWKKNELKVSCDDKIIAGFNRRNQTNRLSNLLYEISNNPS